LTLPSWSSCIETRAAYNAGDFLHSRTAHPLAVEVAEKCRLRVAGCSDRSASAHRRPALDQPGWAVFQRFVGAELDHRAAYVLVAVVDVDVTCARLVRRPRQRTCERCVLDPRADEDGLAGLHVRADLDGDGGVALQAFL
jgi:hypothetical protein